MIKRLATFAAVVTLAFVAQTGAASAAHLSNDGGQNGNGGGGGGGTAEGNGAGSDGGFVFNP